MPDIPYGLYLQDAHPLSEAIELAQYAEKRGFDSIWQAESRLAREATVPMAAYLAVTERIHVGAGVINNWTRNVSLVALTFATLDDLGPGRIRLGIGAWWDPLASKVGIDRKRPLSAMRETVETVARLLNGERVSVSGDFVRLEDVELDFIHQPRHPRDIPIYIGATGMKMMELTGEIADGVLLNYLVSPSYNERALAHLAEGAALSGRSLEDIDRPQLIVCAMSDDREEALHSARLLVTQYLGQQPHLMKASGVPDSLLEEIGRVLTWPATRDEVEAASHLVPDEIVQMICAAGTPSECRAKIDEYVAAGCTSPILYPLGGDARQVVDYFGQ